jgi:hypothetical protein
MHSGSSFPSANFRKIAAKHSRTLVKKTATSSNFFPFSRSFKTHCDNKNKILQSLVVGFVLWFGFVHPKHVTAYIQGWSEVIIEKALYITRLKFMLCVYTRLKQRCHHQWLLQVLHYILSFASAKNSQRKINSF